MTDKLTRIELPGGIMGNGLMDWGEHTAEDMLGQLRRYAAHLRARAEEIESAADEDFQIDVVRGSIVQHHVRTVQAAKAKGQQP